MRLNATVITLSMALVGASLHASPLLGERALPAESLRSLAAQVRAERAAHPDRFAAVAGLQGLRRAVYRSSRSQHPTAVRELRAMGADALFPLIDLLAFSTPSSALDPEAREVLELSALQCLGELRDRRAEPVLRAAFERVSSPDAMLAAARALGALGGDAEIALLSTAARGSGPRATAAVEGLGRSRRADATATIISALDATRDQAVIIAAAHALADAGSSWAIGPDQAATSARCAGALVRAFARSTGAARDELQVAIAAVAAPETLALLAGIRAGASPEQLRRIEQLERMVRRQLR